MVDNADLGVEIHSLRSELKLRILLQNILLQGVTLVFAGLAAGLALKPSSASTICLVFQCVMFAAVLQWCHHGVRTAQIKNFLQELDPEKKHGKWETWLPANRPATLLGSRWMISTKGVFLGLGAMMLLLDVMVSPVVEASKVFGSSLIWVMAALFLFTNPKE